MPLDNGSGDMQASSSLELAEGLSSRILDTSWFIKNRVLGRFLYRFKNIADRDTKSPSNHAEVSRDVRTQGVSDREARQIRGSIHNFQRT
jgi:hypothetical protein